MVSEWVEQGILSFSQMFPERTFFNLEWNVRGMLAVLLVSLICGAVGSLVVGNRMAFFSDALAHCAFAGVSLGFLLALAAGVRNQTEFYQWITPVMVAFGILVGLAIAYVRERTRLANDTVIAVFFAGAVGFGAILLQYVSRVTMFDPENFLFGSPLLATSDDIVLLFLVAVGTLAVLTFMYNDLVLASFNPSLAAARRVRVRLCNTLFIVLLAFVINVCIRMVGVLLINAVLIVPAATAANLCRNMRQLFWVSMAICVLVGIGGQWLSWTIIVATPRGDPQSFGVSGMMVVLSVVLFFVSMYVGPLLRRGQSA